MSLAVKLRRKGALEGGAELEADARNSSSMQPAVAQAQTRCS
jgi:hypothetical protein